MPRGFKKSIADTEAAYASGRLIDVKRRSFISQPKAIVGENECYRCYGGGCEECQNTGFNPQPHLILYGADKTAQRMKLFQRENNLCQTCKCIVIWGGDEMIEGMVGEWKHIRDKAGQKCDCLANAELSCHAHHQGPGTAHFKRRPQFRKDTPCSSETDAASTATGR